MRRRDRIRRPIRHVCCSRAGLPTPCSASSALRFATVTCSSAASTAAGARLGRVLRPKAVHLGQHLRANTNHQYLRRNLIPMKRAIFGLLAAAVLALAPLCIPLAQAHADDPCASIIDPAAHDACIADFVQRREKAQCDASSHQGQLGQLCG